MAEISVISLGDFLQIGHIFKALAYICLAQIVVEFFKGVFQFLVTTALVILGDFL